MNKASITPLKFAFRVIFKSFKLFLINITIYTYLQVIEVKVEKTEEQEPPELPSFPEDETPDLNPPVNCDEVKDDAPPIKREKHSMDDWFGDVFITNIEKPPSVHDRIQSELSLYKLRHQHLFRAIL